MAGPRPCGTTCAATALHSVGCSPCCAGPPAPCSAEPCMPALDGGGTGTDAGPPRLLSCCCMRCRASTAMASKRLVRASAPPSRRAVTSASTASRSPVRCWTQPATNPSRSSGTGASGSAFTGLSLGPVLCCVVLCVHRRAPCLLVSRRCVPRCRYPLRPTVPPQIRQPVRLGGHPAPSRQRSPAARCVLCPRVALSGHRHLTALSIAAPRAQRGSDCSSRCAHAALVLRCQPAPAEHADMALGRPKR